MGQSDNRDVFEVLFLEYDRYSGGRFVRKFGKASSAEATLKAILKNNYSDSEECDREEAERWGRKFIPWDIQKYKDYLGCINGDGCDFILRIKNITKDEIIYEAGISKETDFDQDVTE
jgi:hypothetical protein